MKIVILILSLSLFGCVGVERNLSLKEMSDLVAADLGFQPYEIKYASLFDVRALCLGIGYPVIGCTTYEKSLVSDRLTGCDQKEIVFHELMHQYQLTRHLNTGVYNVSELDAIAYGVKMAAKYCYE